MAMNLELPLSECEVCNQLGDYESSYEKWGSPEQTRCFLAAAARLVSVPGRDDLQQCRICGIYYRYTSSSEYLANGSEDTASLTRLTPTDVSALLPEGLSPRLITWHLANLKHPAALTRAYAGKCCAAQMLAHEDLVNLEKLLSFPDRDVVHGAVTHLWILASDESLPAADAALRERLRLLASHPEKEIADRAAYVLSHGLRK